MTLLLLVHAGHYSGIRFNALLSGVLHSAIRQVSQQVIGHVINVICARRASLTCTSRIPGGTLVFDKACKLRTFASRSTVSKRPCLWLLGCAPASPLSCVPPCSISARRAPLLGHKRAHATHGNVRRHSRAKTTPRCTLSQPMSRRVVHTLKGAGRREACARVTPQRASPRLASPT